MKPIRRAKTNKRKTKEIKVMYSNIQGFVGKKASLTEIMEAVDCDICLLTETMTTNVKIDGLKCVEINMIGVRVELAKNNFKRIYTAHMKQVSTSSKDEIRDQFLEIRNQYKQAAVCNEGMLLICDANVHVGGSEIPGCKDCQDWGGREFGQMIKDEGLHLLNSEELCEGTVTRVDPKNGTKSTLDLVICNEFMIDEVEKMKIDEEELFKPTNYNRKRTTKTDHHTILLQIKVNKIAV